MIQKKEIHFSPESAFLEPLDSESGGWVEDHPRLRVRMLFFLSVCFGSFFLFFAGRSFFLSIIHHDRYAALARKNASRGVYLSMPRGIILDRTGTSLVENRPVFSLWYDPHHGPYPTRLLGALSQALSFSLEPIPDGTIPPHVPQTLQLVADHLNFSRVFEIHSQISDHQELFLLVRAERKYPFGDSFGPLLGYVGKLSPEEWATVAASGAYLASDEIGKAGIEKTFEAKLHGGREYQPFPEERWSRATLMSIDPFSHPDQVLTLTIDGGVQQYAYQTLMSQVRASGGKAGVVWVADIAAGEILAVVSVPSYDNNIFVERKNDRIEALLSDQRQPLFFRPTSGMYAPGSTMKLMVALGALEEGVITPQTSILSTGGISIGSFFFPDWKTGGHGRITVTEALAESVNTFFYYVGGGYDSFSGLGVERMIRFAQRFGLGSPVGVGIEPEAAGFLPSPEWKASRGQRWYGGDTYHFAIGQGDVLVTPVQMLQVIGLIAMNGQMPGLHIQKGMLPIQVRLSISPEHFETVKRGLRLAVTAGSARALTDTPFAVAGKTGTAQHSSGGPPHAWFVGFGPYDKPRYAVVVLIEEGGEGSVSAVPVAKKLFEYLGTHPIE